MPRAKREVVPSVIADSPLVSLLPSAMQIIDDVKSKGGKILSFTSYCGGLPAPDSNNNPLGYKFSWSARGVLLASTNNAIFLQDGTPHTSHPFFSFSFPATKARSYRR